MALVRQPSFLNAENLEKLLHDWREIKQSDEYKTAVEQSNKRTHEQTMQKTELQNLRMKISRLRRQGEDTGVRGAARGQAEEVRTLETASPTWRVLGQ